MAGEVVRMTVYAKFGLWCFLSRLVVKIATFAKPENVMCYAMGHHITTRQFVTFDIKRPFMDFKILTLAL
jgi:hypothetical protein